MLRRAYRANVKGNTERKDCRNEIERGGENEVLMRNGLIERAKVRGVKQR